MGAAVALIALAAAACQPAPATPATGVTQPPPAEPTPAPPTGPPTPAPIELASIRVGLGRAPSTLDPALVPPLDASANDLVANLFVGLARLDGDTQRVVPALAREWAQQPDGLTWHVFLRDDVFWVRINPQTGEVERVRPVTAGDVVTAVRRACHPATGAPLGSSPAVYLIRGCQEIHQRDRATLTPELVEQTIGVRVLNEVAAEFSLTTDTALFPTLLAMPILAPVPTDLIEAEGEAWTQPGAIWTSGPFALDPATPAEQGYTLVANPQWPPERAGNVGRVEVMPATPEDAFRAWQAGEVALAAVPESQVQAALDGDPAAYRLHAQPASMFIVASYDTYPLDNADLRRALALALDREAIIREVLAAHGQAGLPASTIIPPGVALAPPSAEAGWGYDPAAARTALASAGFPDCLSLPPVTLLVSEGDGLSASLAQSVVTMWEAALGCDGRFVVEEQAAFELLTAARELPLDSRQPPRPGLILLGWQGDTPDAHHWLADVLACRELFPAAYLNQARPCIVPEEQLAAAAGQHDDEARAAVYRSLTAAFFSPGGEMPVIPLYTYARPLAISPWLEIPQGSGETGFLAGPLRFDEWVVTR